MRTTVLSVCICIVLSIPAELAAGAKPGRRKGRGPATARRGRRPVDVEKLLATRIAEFSHRGSVLAGLQKISRLVRLRVGVDWKTLKRAGGDKNKKISFTARKATVRQLLDLLLMKAAVKRKPLAWSAFSGAVWVTTQRDLMNLRHRVTRTRRIRKARPLLRGQKTARFLRSVRFDNKPLSEVIDYFRRVTGVNIHANWRAMEPLGVTRDSPVTLRLSNTSVARAMDLVADQLVSTPDKLQRVYWIADGNVVRISTGEALNHRTRTVTYDLGELLVLPIEVQQTQFLNVSSSGRGSGSRSGSRGGGRGYRSGTASSGSRLNVRERNVDRRESQAESIIEIVKDSIGDEMWQPEGKGSIRVMGTRLIVTQTPLGFKLLSDSLRRR